MEHPPNLPKLLTSRSGQESQAAASSVKYVPPLGRLRPLATNTEARSSHRDPLFPLFVPPFRVASKGQ